MEAASTSETLASYLVHYMASRPEDGGNKYIRNAGILPRSLHGVTTWRWRQQISPKRWHPTAFTTRRHDLKMEAANSSETLASYRVHYTVSRPEDGGRKFLRNVGILP